MKDLTTWVDVGSDVGRTTYDAAHHLFYFVTGGTLESYDPTTGTVTNLLTVTGTIGALALTSDGSHVLLGMTETDYNNGTPLGTVYNIDLSKVADPTSYVSMHYVCGFYEGGVYDLSVGPDDQVLMTTNFNGSGWTPFRNFDLSSPNIPGTPVPNLAEVRQSTDLIKSENGRYVLIEEGNISNAPNHLYDTLSHTVVAYMDFYEYPWNGGFNGGIGDISEAAGLVAIGTGPGIFDLNLNLVKDLRDTFAGHSIIDMKFAADGQALLVWQGDTNSIVVYNTTSWEMISSTQVDIPLPYWWGGGARMELSHDGRFLLLESGGKVESLDLQARVHILSSGTPDADELIGTFAPDSLSGFQGDDTLSGLGGDDVLAGGLGNDSIDGGDGNDTVIFDVTTPGGIVVNLGQSGPQDTGEGVDTLVNVENATGSNQNDSLTGSEADNVLKGNGGNDTLVGMGGNDYLVGGAGNDSLVGGAGDDSYVFEAGDTIVELAGGGSDWVLSSVSFTIASGSHLENVRLLGDANLDATGDDGDNMLQGNAGINDLTGLGGNDTYIVNNVEDRVIEQAGQGIDQVYAYVSYTLDDQVENLRLKGTDNIDATGNGLDNIIMGNSGANHLDGMGGNDTLNGGAGDDTYNVHGGERIVEKAGGGVDTVMAGFSYVLGSELENLILTGVGSFNGTGNGLDNVLTGNAGRNVLTGLGGNDTYVIDARDTVVEAADGGIDRIVTGGSYTLTDGQYVEQLQLSGTGNFDATGNAQDNLLLGNDGNNRLDGGLGADVMRGAAGDDTYIVDNTGDSVVELGDGSTNYGNDLVLASVDVSGLMGRIETIQLLGSDNLNITGNTFASSLMGNSGNNRLDDGGGSDTMAGGSGDDTYVVSNYGDSIVENAHEGQDTVIFGAYFGTHTLGANIENLILTEAGYGASGIGNGLNNHLTGNSWDNSLNGGAGADTMTGGGGNDTYWVDSTGDRVVETNADLSDAGGIDTIYASVRVTLGQFVENLTLTGSGNLIGTGNELDNVLTGNDGNNRLIGLAGNDSLSGGLGNDTLAGGAGNDSYSVDGPGDKIVEGVDQGIDTVFSQTSYRLGDNLENLTLNSSYYGPTTVGIGNALDNVLTGSYTDEKLYGMAGNDWLDGGYGSDTMTGGSGNDSYHVDQTGDVVIETSGNGIDTVFSDISYVLGANVENLTLIDTWYWWLNLDATGNAADNMLRGNSQSNQIDGGRGNDTLTGGGGYDRFVFGTHSGADVITDFDLNNWWNSSTLDLRALGTDRNHVTLTDVAGGALMDIGHGNSILLQGISASNDSLWDHVLFT